MKEISELKEKLISRRIQWMRSETTSDYVLNELIDLVIGITEHMKWEPCSLPCRLTEEIQRKATIAALRWAHAKIPLSVASERILSDAITRVENGGTLE